VIKSAKVMMNLNQKILKQIQVHKSLWEIW